MFEKSSTLKLPARSLQPLWRYMSSERLKDLLRSGDLYFAHLPNLEDSREGALTARTREHLATWFQLNEGMARRRAYEQVDEYLRTQDSFYVNCWHMNSHESYLMWKAYGGRGYAVVTTFERLSAAFGASMPVITGGVVEYVDFQAELTAVGNAFNHVVTKDIPYKDEREFRLIYWEVDPRHVSHPRVPGGVRVQVNLKMLIDRVVRSPFCGPVDAELEGLLSKDNLSFEASTVLPR